jgi:hypothetical protein
LTPSVKSIAFLLSTHWLKEYSQSAQSERCCNCDTKTFHGKPLSSVLWEEAQSAQIQRSHLLSTNIVPSGCRLALERPTVCSTLETATYSRRAWCHGWRGSCSCGSPQTGRYPQTGRDPQIGRTRPAAVLSDLRRDGETSYTSARLTVPQDLLAGVVIPSTEPVPSR